MKATDITDFLGFTNVKKDSGVEPEQGKIDRDNLGPRKVFLAWEAVPKAAPVNVDPRYKKMLYIIGGMVAFLLFLMQEFILIMLIASLYFMIYVLNKNPVGKIKYEITSHGMSVNGQLYYWDQLVRFFFSSHFGDEYLAIDLKESLPSRLIVGFNHEDKDKIIENMNKYLPYLEQEPLTFLDKAYKSIVDKFDLEKKSE